MDEDKTFLGMCIIAVLVFFFIAYISHSERPIQSRTDNTMGAVAEQQLQASTEIDGARAAGAGAAEADGRAAEAVERSQAAAGTIAGSLGYAEQQIRECRRLAESSERIFRSADQATGRGAESEPKS